MNRRQFGFWILLLWCIQPVESIMYIYDDAQTALPPSAERILKTLRSGHPRLIMDQDAIARIRKTIEDDSHAARLYEKIRSEARKILDATPSDYRIPDGVRLLNTSKRVLKRVQILALVYLVEGGEGYVDRAWRELEAASRFPDWNPRHFLDTAEMTHAFAVGYDWLYDRWMDEQRRLLREAIVELGLKPGMRNYREGKAHWIRGKNNWNQVCNGGLSMGALAIADEMPDLAGQILHNALTSIPRAMGCYAPDGAGVEGVHYWNYGAWYNIVLLASMESALGTDFGLSQIPGFKESGNYHVFMSGPTWWGFDFSDSWLFRTSTPQHFWMAQQFGIPHYSWFRYCELTRSDSKGEVLDLIWFDDSAVDFDPFHLPLDKHFREAECASMRSAWGDPEALALGIQAGETRKMQMHRQMDLGSFVLDALGERWAMDSSNDMAVYRRHQTGAERWELYRVRAEGHNTLVFNPDRGPDQNMDAVTSIVQFVSEPNRAVAVVDLSDAYVDHARHVQRTFEMPGRSHVMITDEIEANAPADLWWFMHTEAKVELDGARAILSQNGKQLIAEIVSPSGAVFTVRNAEPLPTSPNPKGQADNSGRRKLAIHLTDVRDVKIAVKLAPVK